MELNILRWTVIGERAELKVVVRLNEQQMLNMTINCDYKQTFMHAQTT